jgi:hypothetical protein
MRAIVSLIAFTWIACATAPVSSSGESTTPPVPAWIQPLRVTTGERGYQIHRDHRDPGTHPVARGRFFALTAATRGAHGAASQREADRGGARRSVRLDGKHGPMRNLAPVPSRFSNQRERPASALMCTALARPATPGYSSLDEDPE